MDVKPGYIQIETGMVPENWSIETLGGLGRWLSGGTPSMSEKSYWIGSIPWVSAKDMKVSRLRDASDHVSEKALNYGARLAPQNALLMVVRGMILAHSFPVARAECAVAFNQDIKALVPRDSIESDFLLWWFQAHRSLLLSITTESTHGTKRLPSDILFAQKIGIPPRPEQEAIARALSDADALIASLEQLIAKKRHIKQGTMQELLTGKKRLAGFSGQWGLKPLGEGVRLISGQHVLARHCNIDGHGIPYITGPADFPEGVIQHTKFTTKPGTVCRSGDVLVTVKGSGSGTLVLARADYCISRQLMAVRVTEWNVDYVYFSLMQDASRFNTAATGLIPGLSRNDILTKAISLPPTETEQAAIATVLCDMDAEVAALEAKLSKARLIKQGMMQNLLTGRIRLV